MTQFKPTDEEYNAVIKEVEDIELKKKVEEAKGNKERAESIRDFENLQQRIKER